MKKIICWIVGMVLALVVLMAGIFSYWYFGAANYHLTGVPVLNYHQVNDKYKTALTMTTADFEEQMKYLHDRGYHSITQEQFIQYMRGEGSLPDKPVLITFDDGYIDNYECAYPIMKKYHMTGTVFLIMDLMEKPGYLTWNQVRSMSQNGMEFGSHTISHKPLTGFDEKRMKYELTQSKQFMEQKLGKPVTCIAYPEGKYNDLVKTQTEAAGYCVAFTVNTGRDYPWDDPYELDRVPFFEGPMSFEHFEFRLIFSAFSALLWDTHAYLAHTEWCKPAAKYVPQP